MVISKLSLPDIVLNSFFILSYFPECIHGRCLVGRLNSKLLLLSQEVVNALCSLGPVICAASLRLDCHTAVSVYGADNLGTAKRKQI